MADRWDQYAEAAPQQDKWAQYAEAPQQQEKPGFASALWDQVKPTHSIPAFYHALTDRSEFAAMARDPQFGADLADATKRKQFVGPPAPGQTMYGQRATSQAPEDVPSYGQIAGNLAGTGINAALTAAAFHAAPPVMRATGRVLKRTGGQIAEAAMSVRAADRAHGRTPGEAIINDTSGYQPLTVAKSAGQTMGLLTPELEARAAASTTPVDIQPARDVIARRMTNKAAGNSSQMGELTPMREHLTTPQPGFSGAIDPATGEIAANQSALDALRLKREFGEDHTTWNQLQPNKETAVARRAYGLLDEGFDNAVPEAADLNQRISSLIPVKARATAADLNAGFLQRVAHRWKAHTGALTSAGAGYYAGGVPGAIAGLLIPEIAASPTVQMGAARGLAAAGRGLVSTAAQKAAQAALLSGGLLSIDQKKRRRLLQ